MRVYLNGSIDGLGLGEAKKWRSYTTKQLKKHGIETYDPTLSINKKYLKSSKPLVSFPLHDVEKLNARELVKRDLTEMLKCDIVLCYMILPETLVNRYIPFGTQVELGVAFWYAPHIPIIGVTNCMTGKPFWDGICDKSYNMLDEAINCIVESVEGFKLHHS